MPSCRKCNNGASKDDEYFKTMMVMKDRAGTHPEAVALHASVFRALSNPHKVGFTRAILRSMTRVPVQTPAGIYLGHAGAYNVDLARLDRVVTRITRGLFWHHRQRRIPAGVEVVAYSEEGMRGLSDDVGRIVGDVIGPVLQQPVHTIGSEVLRYRFLFATDTEFASAWVLEFYRDVRWVAITVPDAHREVTQRENTLA